MMSLRARNTQIRERIVIVIVGQSQDGNGLPTIELVASGFPPADHGTIDRPMATPAAVATASTVTRQAEPRFFTTPSVTRMPPRRDCGQAISAIHAVVGDS